ncbi:TolB family protein [Leifsonia sp. NPDC058292]|uniref:TolB family protein n=1 Tax=Leifsonia sp. NPDC058292 TaxID=3346428 RepID=UPI0036DAB03F
MIVVRVRSVSVALVVVGIALSGCTGAVPSSGSSSGSHTADPPGGQIVYRQYLDADGKTGALFVANTNGTQKTQLTKPVGNETDAEPDWSPDGKRIVFSKQTDVGLPTEAHAIDLMNADGTDPVALTAGNPSATETNFNDQPVFSPDGASIAYAHGDGNPTQQQLTNTGIYVMRNDGTGQHEVVAMAPGAADVGGVAWSPDGKQLVYCIFNTGSGQPSGGRAFFVVNTDGTGGRQLTKWDSGADGTPDWSAATGRIAFRVAPDEESGVGNFYTVDSNGTGRTQITHLKHATVSHKVSFSPDGTWIVYAAAGDDGVTHLALAPVNGSARVPIATGKYSSSGADWSPKAG